MPFSQSKPCLPAEGNGDWRKMSNRQIADGSRRFFWLLFLFNVTSTNLILGHLSKSPYVEILNLHFPDNNVMTFEQSERRIKRSCNQKVNAGSVGRENHFRSRKRGDSKPKVRLIHDISGRLGDRPAALYRSHFGCARVCVVCTGLYLQGCINAKLWCWRRAQEDGFRGPRRFAWPVPSSSDHRAGHGWIGQPRSRLQPPFS